MKDGGWFMQGRFRHDGGGERHGCFQAVSKIVTL